MKIGMKPAGGIATSSWPCNTWSWCVKRLDRIKNADLFVSEQASCNDLLMQILKERTGVYQSIDYFPKTNRGNGSLGRNRSQAFNRWQRKTNPQV